MPARKRVRSRSKNKWGPYIFPAMALIVPQQSADLPEDTTTIEVRVFDDALLAAQRQNPDYIYEANQSRVDSILDRLLQWVFDMLREILPGGAMEEGFSTVSNVLTMLFYVLIGGLVVWGILQVTGLERSGFFKKGDRKPVVGVPDVTEDQIADIDFEELAKQAIDREAYNAAIRYYYLYVLTAFDQFGIIRWQPHKTNQDYLDECCSEAPSLHRALQRLTLLFDHAWYGAFPVSLEVVQETQRLARQTVGQVQNRHTGR